MGGMILAAFIDYYEMFELDRSMTEKELKGKLKKWSADLTNKEGTTPVDDVVTRQEQRELRKHIMDAIRILGKTDSRKKYDAQLDEAVQTGNVNHAKVQEVKDALERARRFFEQQKYEQAMAAAKEALEHHANTDEPYEIISRSQFMLGDYEESLATVDQGAEAFSNAQNLWWLRIRTRIMMERYDDAQYILNQAISKFYNSARFTAEQAYLYFHADKIDLGERTMENYIRAHPDDREYRQYMAYNLIELSNYCYRYDTAAEMQLIIAQADYSKCLELVRLANQIYQDDFTRQSFEDVQCYGELRSDKESVMITKIYTTISVMAAVIGIFLFSDGSSFAMIPFLVSGIFFVFRYIVKKKSNLPVWQINRDYYRGYKETGEGWLYALATSPFDLVISWLRGQ